MQNTPKIIGLNETFNKFDTDKYIKSYMFIKGFAVAKNLKQTLIALAVARHFHNGQYRKDGNPYIIHPLKVCTTLISYGIDDDTTLAAALLHDIGKFYQRTTKISLLNSQEIASTPIHANGYHTHIHSGYTAKFFHDYLHLNDQLEKASSGHHINEVDEFDSIIRDADRIASKIDRNDENFDFEENHKKTRYQYITSRLSSIMGNIDFGQTIYDSKFKLTSVDQCMNPCRNNIEQNTIESIEEYKKLFTQFIEEIKFDNLLIGKPTPINIIVCILYFINIQP